MHLLTTATAATALTALHLASHATAYIWDKQAAEFCEGDFFSTIMPPPEGSWGKLLVNENEECYIVFNEIFGCKGPSKPFASYNANTGDCDAFGGAEPMAAPICNGFLWLYGKDAKDTFVPPNKKTTNVSAGDVYVRIMQDKRKEVNLVPYHLGKAGCGFAPVYRNGEYQYLDEDCGLVRKPVGKWTG